MNLTSIGKNIRKYRTLKKMSQEILAQKTSLSVNYIGMIERGEKTPSLESFINIVNALGISADMVLVEVLDKGYEVRDSLINESIAKLSIEDKNKIYDVIDTLITHSKKLQ